MTWILLKLAGFVGNAWMLRINAFFDLIAKLLAFIFKHWRVFLGLAIAWYGLSKYYEALNDAARWQSKYTHLVAENKEAQEVRKIQNESKAEAAKFVVQQIEADAKKEITQILIKERKNHANQQAVSDRDLTNARERLRLELEKIASATPAGLPNDDPNPPAGSDCDTAAVGRENEILRAGGAVCASDYNKCKAYVDAEQLRLGVEQ